MGKHLTFLIFIFSFIFFVNCTERERLNPIDPNNRKTSGRPQGLKIYSEYDQAVLQWNSLELNDFLGYRIYRQTGLDTAFHLVNLTPPDSSVFTDKNLIFGQKYEYQVSVLGTDFESERSDSVSIIPGPSTIWATDVYNRRIMKISHDCAHEIFQIPVDGYPWEVVVDHENENVWYIDILLNQVCLISGNDYHLVASMPNGEPIDIALDVQNDRVWVADETQGKIFVFSRSGDQLYEIGGFALPSGLDCYFKDGSCWIPDNKARTVTKLSKKGTMRIQIKDLIFPQAVAINQTTGDFWVADSSRILKYDVEGNLLLQIEEGVNAPSALAVDSANGRCWVIDINNFRSRSRLLCFDENGSKIVEVPDLNYPMNLAINPFDHSCIIAESGNGSIVKISEDGAILGTIAGYAYPRGLFLEYMR